MIKLPPSGFESGPMLPDDGSSLSDRDAIARLVTSKSWDDIAARVRTQGLHKNAEAFDQFLDVVVAHIGSPACEEVRQLLVILFSPPPEAFTRDDLLEGWSAVLYAPMDIQLQRSLKATLPVLDQLGCSWLADVVNQTLSTKAEKSNGMNLSTSSSAITLGIDDRGDRFRKAARLRLAGSQIRQKGPKTADELRAVFRDYDLNSDSALRFLNLLQKPTGVTAWDTLPLYRRSTSLIDQSVMDVLGKPEEPEDDLLQGMLFDRDGEEYGVNMLTAWHAVLATDHSKPFTLDELHKINGLSKGMSDESNVPEMNWFGLANPTTEGIRELSGLIEEDLENAVCFTGSPASEGASTGKLTLIKRYTAEEAVTRHSTEPIFVTSAKSHSERVKIAEKLIDDFNSKYLNNETSPIELQFGVVKLAKCLDVLHLFFDGNCRTANLLINRFGYIDRENLRIPSDPNHLESRTLKEFISGFQPLMPD